MIEYTEIGNAEIQTEDEALWICQDQRDSGEATISIRELDEAVGLKIYGPNSALTLVLEQEEATDLGTVLHHASGEIPTYTDTERFNQE